MVICATKKRLNFSSSFLLFNQDSNLDKQDQNLLCCHYTIEQYGRFILTAQK